MTNLEWLNEIGMITTNRVAPNGKLIGVNLVIALRDDDFTKYSEKGFGWLLEEHKEKIKLTEFEHDVIKAFTKLPSYEEGDRIEDFSALLGLWSVGWFRNIDENLSIKYILDNCEVIDK